MDALWKNVLEEVELEVSRGIFLTFFKKTRLVSIESSVATISSPTRMIQNYIEKRYYGILKRILDKKTGEDISLIFTSQGKPDKAAPELGPLFISPDRSIHTRPRPKRIRPDYTFDTLAVSESNQLAYTASLTIANDPGGKYNPLFMHGTVGVGKTHLMHSVANKVFDEKEDAKILYLTTEEFTNEVVEAIRDKSTPNLRKKFRNLDLLLLDDIQFLSGKEKVQEELFHTFNSLIDKGCQIIFSSDRPPHEIKKIEARLASRFEGGLTVDIQPPDFELRTAILLIKAAKYGFNLTIELAKIAAGKITDTRALEGFLLRVATSLTARSQTDVTEDIITPLLGKSKDFKKILHPDTVIDVVCDYYRVKATQLKGVKRDAVLVRPRQVCMFILKGLAGRTHVEIGNLLGGRDHTTIMYGVEKIRSLLEKDERLMEDMGEIKKRLTEAE